MVNTKGYIKTLEAVIAIVIILIFTFAVTPKPEPSYQLPSSVENAQNYILEEIERNDTLRQNIMDADLPIGSDSPISISLSTIVNSNMPTGYGYITEICNNTVCMTELPPEATGSSVYTAEAMIGSDGVVDTTPRIVRIWMWRKQAA